MENVTPNQNVFNNPPMQQPLPNATTVLVLGILSILGCCGYGIVGLVLAIIALVLANKDEKLYRVNPGFYTIGSYKNLRAGKTCAIIGLVLFALAIVFAIMIIASMGVGALMHPQEWQSSFNP